VLLLGPTLNVQGAFRTDQTVSHVVQPEEPAAAQAPLAMSDWRASPTRPPPCACGRCGLPTAPPHASNKVKPVPAASDD
jgi:hypothetical protein